jgi:hypothetical protein
VSWDFLYLASILVKHKLFSLTNKKFKVTIEHIDPPPLLTGDFYKNIFINQSLNKGISGRRADLAEPVPTVKEQ